MAKSTSDNKQSQQPQTMEELLQMTDYKPVVPQKGDRIKGKIILKNDKMLKVDIGAKTVGVVTGNEFDFAQDFIEELEEGDELEATVISTENQTNQILLSLKGAANDAKWEYFEEALEEDKELDAKGIEANKGGLIVVINGVRGFVPSSQFSRKYVGSIEQLKDQKFKVKAIEVDRERNRLIFSERHVSEAKQLAQKEQALDMVKEDAIYEGVISGVKSFGLFMTVEVPVNKESAVTEQVEINDQEKEVIKADKKEHIGYVEGLIHISEISWEKVEHPKNYHQVGDRVPVVVLGVDESSGKLNLSLKRLEQDPWKKVAEEYPVGTTFTGQITRSAPFGLFVGVMPGVDGLIHASKLGPGADLKVGDEVTVNVDSVDPQKRRMSLSMVLTEVPMGYK
ncbi:MAG: S1 RNA-binding domain-containing protein [Candidatus Pacebacteria bacterium]|nr:S1 RNA-binding domain-containing protein [Candidatus Paceibacterota bacterium]